MTSTMLDNTESIVELSNIIATNSARVSAYLADNGLPQPSFTATGPSTSQIPLDAVEIEAARLTVIDATQRLRNLLLGPHDYLVSMTPCDMVSMQAVSRFGLASLVPVDGSASYTTLEAASGLPEPRLRRLLRHAIAKNVFCEAGPDAIAHNAVSRLLADKPMLNAWLRFSSGDSLAAASQVVEALSRWPESEEPDKTGFAIGSGTDMGAYDAFQADPARGKRFANAMKILTESPGYDAGHLVSGYDWASLRSAVVVDLGGSHGAIAKRLTESFPALTVVVQDLPEVIAQAPPSDSRVRFMVHDFFEPQPVVADVYLFRWILHNWSDTRCVRILRALVPVLKPGARIIINEHVFPARNDNKASRWKQERLIAADLVMLQLFNSKEREIDDWALLFEMADPRFRFKGSHQPIGSRLSVLEAVWEG